MKKLISLLIALAMVLSMAPMMPVAHAATHDAPLADTAKTSNWLQETWATLVGNVKDMVSLLNTSDSITGPGMIRLDANGENVEYVYTAEKSGTLYITVVAYGCNGTDWGADAFEHGEETTLSVNGQVLNSLENTITVAAGDEVKVVLTSLDGYAYFAKLYLSYEGYYVPALGSEEKPYELTYADVSGATPYEVTIPAGQSYWFYLNGEEFDIATMEVHGQNAFVYQTYRVWGGWNEETVNAVDGVVTFTRRTEMIQIGNAGDTAATFTITASIPVGIRENPDDLPVGSDSVTVDVAEASEYFFQWTATANGTLEIKVAGENWFYTLSTDDAYMNVASVWEDDPETSWDDSSDTITVTVTAGEEISFMLGTLASDYTQPASSITVSASFTAVEAKQLTLGKNTVAVGAGATSQFTWTASESGLLAITMTASNWSYAINGGQTYTSGQEKPVNMQVVKVAAGDVVNVVIGTADNAAATVTFKAAFCQGTQDSPIYVDFNAVGTDRYSAMNVLLPATGTYVMSAWAGSPQILLVDSVLTTVTTTSDPLDFYTVPTFEVTVTDASQPCLLELTYPLGYYYNPQEIVAGDKDTMMAETNQVTVPGYTATGGPGNYYLEWVASQDSLLALNMLGENWYASFLVYDENNNKVYDSDLTSDAAFLVTVEVLALKAGERVLVIMTNPSSNPLDVSFTAYAAAGTADDPVLLSFDWNDDGNGAALNATLPVGEYVYGFMGDATMVLTANDEDTSITAGNRMMGVPNSFTINNTEEDPYIYELVLSYPVGHASNPDTLVMGENTADIAAGTQGYYYTWTATADGTLTITMPAGNWYYTINNMTTYIYGESQYSNSDPVVNPAVIEVKAGNVIEIIVNTYDPMNPYNAPAGTLVITADFDDGSHRHALTKVDAKAATCTTDGNIEYYTCSCGMWFSDAAGTTEITDHNSVVLPAGHTLTAVAKVAATCTTDGMEAHDKCSVCGKLFVNGVEKTEAELKIAAAHTLTAVAKVAATCTTDGMEAHDKCSVCNKLFVNGVEKTEAELKIAAAHTLTAVAKVEATCTAEGMEAHDKCSVCGKLFVNGTEKTAADLVIAKAAHDMGDWTQTKAPTETEKGEETRKCKNCDYSETREVAELSHTHTLTKVEAKAATCTTDGNKEYYTCTCGKWFADAEGKTEITDKNSVVEAKTGIHEYVDGKCKHCGAEEPKTVLWGDVNGDGAVNTRDAKLIMQYELKLIDATQLDLTAADVNGDGEINTRDAKLIMQYELKIITEFPVEKQN